MNYWERLLHLKLMLLQHRGNGIPFLILMMWKILHNVVPNCSNIRFTKTSTHMVPWAIIPYLSRLSSLSTQTLYDSSFAVRGPKLWNKVPDSITAAATFKLFKVSFKLVSKLVQVSCFDTRQLKLQLVQFPGRLLTIEVVRHLMTLPAMRINSNKVTKVKWADLELGLCSGHQRMCISVLFSIVPIAWFDWMYHTIIPFLTQSTFRCLNNTWIG